MKDFPDSFEKGIDEIISKSSVLPLGLELPEFQKNDADKPIFLWNHRWEYDKNPDVYFNSLKELKNKKIDFGLIVLGRQYKQSPKIFNEVLDTFSKELIHFGFVESREKYEQLLAEANILLVTNNQDFFGISVVEGIAAGCYPCLPNRLSYPEHIPDSLRNYVFYDQDDEIVPLLVNLIENERYKEREPYSTFVHKYQWSSLINKYDSLCDSLKLDLA